MSLNHFKTSVSFLSECAYLFQTEKKHGQAPINVYRNVVAAMHSSIVSPLPFSVLHR